MVFLKIEKEHDDKLPDEDKETAEKNCDRWKSHHMDEDGENKRNHDVVKKTEIIEEKIFC